MHATVGDTIRIRSTIPALREHVGEIMEIRGDEGEPPYLVRFGDEHQQLVYPGPGCMIEPRAPMD